MPDQMLTVKDLADHLGVSEKTIYAWRYRNESLPPAYKIGGQLRFDRDEVMEWRRSQREDQTDDRPAA